MPPRHTAGYRSGSGRCKPSGGNDGTNTWNCQQAKPGQGTKRAQGHGANARSGGGTFGAIIAAVAVLVMLGINRAAVGVVPAIGVAGQHADVAAAEAGGFELADSFGGGTVIVEHTGDNGGHVLLPC